MNQHPFDSTQNANAPRKVRFKPKAPPKRAVKPVLPKVEKYEDDVDEAKAEHLLRRFNETSSTVRHKTERKVAPTQVAFGFGASSKTHLKSYGSAKAIKNEGPSSDADGLVGQNVKEYKEPWDYYTNYPALLPLREPHAGNPELLDKEEFGEDCLRKEYEEPAVNVAEELGLLNEGENCMFFLQLPSIPSVVSDLKSQDDNKNAKSPSKSQFCNLKSLPEGLIGKMLIYKSGAVKLKIGDVLYQVFDGLNCTVAQDLVAINAEKKQCCNFGEVSKCATVIPDIDSMLEDISEL